MSGTRKFAAAVLAVLLAAGIFTGVYVQRTARRVAQLPVLMYHQIGDTPKSDMTVCEKTFEMQMRTLAEGGWHAVTTEQLIAFADRGVPLPDRPVLITFDDGYASNLELAAPILEKYGLHAVISVIGSFAEQEEEQPTRQAEPLRPFALREAVPWRKAGVLELESHTYNLHDRAEKSPCGRDGMLPLEGESPEDYRRAMEEDMEKERDLFREQLGEEIQLLAYPYGLCCGQSEEVLKQEGIRITLTTASGPNRIVQGKPESLCLLNRFTVTDADTSEDLRSLLLWREENLPEKVLRHLGIRIWK